MTSLEKLNKAVEELKLEIKLSEHVKRINAHTNRIAEIDALKRTTSTIVILHGASEYYDSKKSGEYTGD